MTLKPTVLIADDDPRNIYALKAVLLLKGYQILTAADGRECLAVLEKHPETNIVLMDMMMPGMDGYEAIAALRQHAEWRNLPVIAVTAQAMTGDREKCLAAGATDYLAKPIDDVKLLAMLITYLNPA